MCMIEIKRTVHVGKAILEVVQRGLCTQNAPSLGIVADFKTLMKETGEETEPIPSRQKKLIKWIINRVTFQGEIREGRT